MNQLNYKQIRTRKIYEEVAEQIRSRIISGQLKPGEKLASIGELAENFQVGRSAVREALSALKAMGLVEMKQGEGTFVREYDPTSLSQILSPAAIMNKHDVLDLMEVRKIVEAGSVELASRKWTSEDLLPIEEALEEMRLGIGIGDEEMGEKADLRFHLSIAKASHNRLLMELMNTISDTMAVTMRETRRVWLYREQATTERLYKEHMAIYDAIRNRDAKEAQRMMLEHLNKVESTLRHHIIEAEEMD